MVGAGPAVKFFGARGSYPAMGKAFARYGGNTSSICITLGDRDIILDGGLGLIPLGQAALGQREHTIFLSHTHYDHLIGLPFFAPLFTAGNRVRVFAPAPMLEALKRYWGPPYFPLRHQDLPAALEILPTPEGTVDLAELLGLPDCEGDPLLVTRFLNSQFHPADGVMLHRISYHGKDVVYATDVELPSGDQCRHVSDFCTNADLLICDAQYEDTEYWGHHQGFGHNSVEMTIRLAQMAKVRRLVLFHHAPDRNDDALDALEKEACARFPGTRAAYEGLEIKL